MRCKIALVVAAVGILLTSACQKPESEAEAEARMQQARADSLRMAEELYDAAVFDTLTWASPEARLERGQVVYRTSCEKCHGPQGGGNGEAALQFQIEVPSFQVPDWQYAGDLAGLRHRIFVGYTGEMPNWGLVGLKYRDIDAAAGHILARIRPPESAEN